MIISKQFISGSRNKLFYLQFCTQDKLSCFILIISCDRMDRLHKIIFIQVLIMERLYYYSSIAEIKENMQQTAIRILLLVATLSSVQVLSNQCIRYNGSQCLECSINNTLNGTNCIENMVQIKQKSSNERPPLSIIQDMQGNTFNLIAVQQKIENNISSASLQNQPINPSINHSKNTLNQQTSFNSVKFIKIEPFDPNQITEKSDQIPITLSDIRKFSANAAYIQSIFSNYSQLVLKHELNKISLQLFQFSRQSTFGGRFDPLLQKVLSNIQGIYGQKLKIFCFLAAYFRYSAFAKIYKIFYVNLSSITMIQIDEVDAIVDLFHMQVFTSSYSVYSTIQINENTIESILNSTKIN